jgi:hypothetical protein
VPGRQPPSDQASALSPKGAPISHHQVVGATSSTGSLTRGAGGSPS